MQGSSYSFWKENKMENNTSRNITESIEVAQRCIDRTEVARLRNDYDTAIEFLVLFDRILLAIIKVIAGIVTVSLLKGE